METIEQAAARLLARLEERRLEREERGLAETSQLAAREVSDAPQEERMRREIMRHSSEERRTREVE